MNGAWALLRWTQVRRTDRRVPSYSQCLDLGRAIATLLDAVL